MEDRFLLERLEAADLSPMVPLAADRIELHRIIYDELCRGIVTNASIEKARRLIFDAALNGADSVILGCTEICMLIKPEREALDVYDTAAIHASALVDFSLTSKCST
jgi:aspartate racemase